MDETQPLLKDTDAETQLTSPLVLGGSALEGAAIDRNTALRNDGESFDDVPKSKRQLGTASAMFIVFNRVIGTGIYATPSLILRSSGSVGVALLMWLLGASIAAAGTAVFIELGTGLPKSGGEKNYLEYMYRRPKFLTTCVFVGYAIMTGSASANSVVFGEYTLHALSLPPTPTNTHRTALLVLTLTLLIHSSSVRAGLRIQNTLGTIKLVVLCAIAGSGILCALGVRGFRLYHDDDGAGGLSGMVGGEGGGGGGFPYERSRNFSSWKDVWEGSGTGVNAFGNGVYNVIWSFTGYSGANYALSEIRNPIRTIKRAVPLALLSVTLVYMLVNVAYFAVVSKGDILGGRRIVAALYFRNLFGPTAEKALSAFIALSTLGNILAGQFTQGRVLQELGREGVLPYSSFFASNKPFNAPAAGLFTQYLFSCAFMLLPPPGDVYLFMINVSSYSSALINTLVSFGLLLLTLSTSYKSAWGWNPPVKCPTWVVAVFFASNCFLVGVPLIKPKEGNGKVYEHLPYWLHPLVAVSVSLIGVAYWYVRVKLLPKRGGYELRREWVRQEDGVRRFVFRKVPLDHDEI